MLKGKKFLTTAITLLAIIVLSVACSGNKTNNVPNNNSTTNDVKEPANEVTPNADPKTLRFTLGSDPPSLDPGIMTDAQSSIVASGLYEGLMILDAEGEPNYGIAEGHEVSADGLTHTFKLRSNATWSNGDPVTAHDFEYAWKRALTPELASEYAYILYYVQGAAEYNSGEGSVDDVKVKAIDDTTLEVTLISPTPYFTSLVTHYTYWPVHKATVEARDDWAIDAATITTNGPFLLKEWVHNDKVVLVKNPNYYNSDSINFDEVTMYIVEDDSTVYNMFQNDEIDWIGAQAGSVPNDYTALVIANKEAEVKDISSVYYYLFNTTEAPFNNVKVRQAFSMAIDRQSIIDNVTQANQTAAYGLVPGSIAGIDGKSFRELYPDTAYFTEDAEKAKVLLAEGLAELGLTSFPPTTLIYNTSDGHKAIAEAIVDMWRSNLGVELTLANSEFGTFLETRSAQQFSIARGGWGADFNHAINFTYDLIYSTSGNNDGKYTNAKVDQLLDESIKASTEEERLAKIAEAERITFQEDMGLMPIYYYTTVTMVKPHIVNVVSDYAGHINWINGDIK
jgi:oligopeptide transport system substrate-binding protein